MAWSPSVIIDVPDLSEKDRADMDLTGFVQWADQPVAATWIEEAYRLTRPELEAEYDAKPWSEQRKYMSAILEALSKIYRALNLKWQYDPAANEIYRDNYGQFLPVDNAPCEPIFGFVALLSRGPQAEKFDVEIWRKLKGDRPLVDVMIPDPIRAEYERSRIAAQERGRREPIEPPGLPPRRFEKKMQEINGPWGAILVVPAYLDFSSMPVLLSWSFGGADNSVPSQRFDGVFTAMACGVPPREVPKDQVPTWNCCMWDDAPYNTWRWLPPLRWSLPFLRALAESAKRRGTARIIMDTRVRCMLENLARARQYDTTTTDLDVSIIDTVKRLRESRFASEDDRATLQVAAGAVCGTVTLINPMAGGVCAGLAVVANALAGILPLAVGCDIDAWGQPLPSGIEPRISREQPPPWTPVPPPGVVPIVGTWIGNVATERLAQPLQVDRKNIGTVNDLPPVKGGSTPTKDPTAPVKKSSGGLVKAAGAFALLYAVVGGSK